MPTSYINIFVSPELSNASLQAGLLVKDDESYNSRELHQTTRSIARTLRSNLGLGDVIKSLNLPKGQDYASEQLINAVSPDLKEATERWLLLHEIVQIDSTAKKQTGSLFMVGLNSYYQPHAAKIITAPLHISNQASLDAAFALAATLEVYTRKKASLGMPYEVSRDAAIILTQLEIALSTYCKNMGSDLETEKNRLQNHIRSGVDMLDPIHKERNKSEPKDTDQLVETTDVKLNMG